jgi:hypothetical protein
MKHIKLFEQFLNEGSIWKTNDGLGINQLTAKSINSDIKKIIKAKNTIEGKDGNILTDDKGNIVFFEVTSIGEEVAKELKGSVVTKIETKDGLTHSASSRGGVMITI